MSAEVRRQLNVGDDMELGVVQTPHYGNPDLWYCGCYQSVPNGNCPTLPFSLTGAPVHLYTCIPATCVPIHLCSWTCSPNSLYTGLNACIPVHMYTYSFGHLCTCIYIYLHTSIPTCLYSCSSTHLHTCKTVHLPSCAHS